MLRRCTLEPSTLISRGRIWNEASVGNGGSDCPGWVDTVEKLDFLSRSQFLRQQAGFKKNALRVRQKS